MRLPSDSDIPLDRVILLLALALFLLISPFMLWWARDTAPWYLPYLFWALLIGLTAWLQTRRRKP
ncbi:MAG: hypothetical protein HUJ29_00415 [Gammaproteobacteria bacterium]|nr:hypothetical protein [Gammaproteobacteria bacterium]